MERSVLSHRPPSWLLPMVAGVAFAPALVLGSTGVGSYTNAWVIAAVMIASGLLCTLAAAFALATSIRLGFEENALVAAALTASGALVLAHGLLSPGAFFDDSMQGFGASGQLSAVVVIPSLAYLVVRRRQLDDATTWRAVSLVMPIAGGALAASLFFIDVFEPLKPETFQVAALVVVAVGVQLAVAWHFADLARRFGDRYSLHLSVALLINSAVPIFFYFGGPGTGAYWWAHGLCMAGVAIASIAIWRKAQEASIASQLVGSVLTTKPMQALNVDVAPTVAQRLRDITDPADPRLRVALDAGRTLAGLQHEQDLDPATLLPIFRSTLETIETASSSP